MTKILSFFLLVVLIGLNTLSQALQTERYDAVYVSVLKEYTLNEDGSSDYRCVKVVKLQNYRSFHRLFGETFIVYNPDYQQVTIREAFTVMADGKVVITPANAFNEVLPRFAAYAPAFNRLRELVITHTGLEIGATIHLDYQIHSQKGINPFFMGEVLLAEDQPVQQLTLRIKVPDNETLLYRLYHSKLELVESKENGTRVYTYTAVNIPARSPEDHQPGSIGEYPCVQFSVARSYQKIVAFLWNQPAFHEPIPSPVTRLIPDLLSDNKNNGEKVFTIQETVVNDLNLFPVPEEYLGYQLRTPEQVWASNGGTPAEKALLMVSLLRQAGIPAELVIALHGDLFDRKVATLTNVDQWIVSVKNAGEDPVYLSVKEVNAFDMTELMPQAVFLIIHPDGSFSLKEPERTNRVVFLKGTLVVHPDLKMTGELNGELTGGSNPYLAFQRSPKKLAYYFAGGLSSKEIQQPVLSLSTPRKTIFTCTVDKESALRKDTSFFWFSLPVLKTGIESGNIKYLESNRSTPFECPAPVDERYQFTMAVPEQMTLVTVPREISISNEAGTFLFQVQQKGKTIGIKKEIVIPEKVISPEHYPAFKELIDYWNLKQTRELVFRK